MTYTKGYPGYFDYQNFGSWALVVENGEIVEKGPCAAGTVTVSRSGDSYTFTLDIEDDMQYAVSGTTTVEFSRGQGTQRPGSSASHGISVADGDCNLSGPGQDRASCL